MEDLSKQPSPVGRICLLAISIRLQSEAPKLSSVYCLHWSLWQHYTTVSISSRWPLSDRSPFVSRHSSAFSAPSWSFTTLCLHWKTTWDPFALGSTRRSRCSSSVDKIPLVARKVPPIPQGPCRMRGVVVMDQSSKLSDTSCILCRLSRASLPIGLACMSMLSSHHKRVLRLASVSGTTTHAEDYLENAARKITGCINNACIHRKSPER
jgi:hypothetical protein